MDWKVGALVAALLIDFLPSFQFFTMDGWTKPCRM